MATRRIPITASTPLVVGNVYEFEGPITGTPPTSKSAVEQTLKASPALKPLGFTVLDWAARGNKYVTRIKITSIPTQTTSNEPAAAIAPVVWVVGIIAAALIAGWVSWRYTQIDLYKFESIPDVAKPIVYLASNGLPLLLGGLAILAFFAWRMR